MNDKGEAWRIGIEKPEAGTQNLQLIVELDDLGMATSGDYKNYLRTGWRALFAYHRPDNRASDHAPDNVSHRSG